MNPTQADGEAGLLLAADDRLVLVASYFAGMPRHWMTEVGEGIGSAVMDLIDYRAGIGPAPSGEALRLVRAYFEYYLNAPLWHPHRTELAALHAQIITARTLDDLNAWADACRAAGLDAL